MNPAETKAGTLEEALANGWQMLRERPDMALAQAQAILRREPRNTEALRLAGSAHRARTETALAEQAELAAIHHSQRIPALIAAAKALDAGQYGEASRLAAEHLGTQPDDLAALTLSAESALALSLPDKAEPLLRMVLGRAPSFAPARMLLINSVMMQDKFIEARKLLQEVMKDCADDETALALLARIETSLNDHEAAAATYERLLKTMDEKPEIWTQYGDALRFIGRKIDSRLAYQRALVTDRHFGQAWWSLVNLDAAGVSDAMIQEMEEALIARAGEPEDAGNLNFALGSAYDAKARHEEAFRHFEAGNKLRREAQPYDARETSEQVDRYIASMQPRSLPQRRERGSRAPVPIFIVGMPRSGSTLVERILGRHSMIEGLGELPIVPHIIESLKLEDQAISVEAKIAGLKADRLRAFGQRYLDRACEHRRSDSAFFVDKLHMNWRHLGLILRILPEARVIDVRRSALDCCWSNYKLLFARGHPAASDLGDLGRFYVDYVRFIDHIEAIAPGRVHQLRYEAVIDDIEAETRSMLAHIGVPFEPQCVDFHLSDQPVATASSEQVRRPLNREGIGAWRPYAKWLGPLQEALGDLAEA